jgi:hypothetical protein
MRERAGAVGVFLYDRAERAGRIAVALSFLLTWLLIALRMDAFRMFLSDLSMHEFFHFLMMLPMSGVTALVIWFFIGLPFGWLLLTIAPGAVRLLASGLLRFGGYRQDAESGVWQRAGPEPGLSVGGG